VATREHRSGFAALIGRPNVGKSTLLNRLTGEKLAIVSHKPQTTRNRILGVVTRPEGQVAFLDTPGIHQAKGELNRFMVEVALRAIVEVDLVLFMVEAQKGASPELGPGDRFILERIQKAHSPSLLVINKIDEVQKPVLLPLMDLYRKEFPFLEVMPISAMKGDGVEELFRLALSHLPLGPPLFDEDMLTDQQERALVAELIREQVLHKTHQEVPYSAAVVVDAFDEAERAPRGRKGKRAAKEGALAGLVRIFATLYVERESQKAIVIGKRGAMLKAIGSGARRSIERMLGTHVYLSLQVKVEERWSERPEGLRKLGYE
jgi:GTP-binding protein Era